jgi:hypothetical protein
MATRVEWKEIRAQEPYLVIADLTPKGWEFWERSSWEVCWYQTTSTPQLIANAERVLKGSARCQAA